MPKSSKILIRVLLYFVSLFIVVTFSLAIGSIGSSVYDIVSVDMYSASSRIIVKLDDGEASDDNFSATGETITDIQNLAENVSVVFKYSQEIQDVIPAGYEIEIESIENSNILEITVTGADPHTCADTANAIAGVSPEVFAKYFSDVAALTFGGPATPNYMPINSGRRAFINITLISAAVLAVAAVSIIVTIELIIFSIKRHKAKTSQ